MRVNTGRWTEKALDDLILKSSRIVDTGERIAFLSRQFLGTGYRESTLEVNTEGAEELVINLGAVDCFTFVDYVEAMRLSRSFAGFIEKLGRIRYRRGEVSFRQRNHFFTDWRDFNAEFVEDVTGKAGGGHAVRVEKMLNEKGDGTKWVAGLAVVERGIDYIPSPLPDDVLARLKTGDYAGVYSEAAGLDVSHVGIVVRHNGLFLRHASSKHRQVVDEDLREYFSNKPGVIVLRPKSPGDMLYL